MSAYNNDVLDRLNALPILEVARKLNIPVVNRRAKCWIHEDANPSLSFDIKRNRWKCFGCDAGGNVIKLVESWGKITFSEACQWLCDKFGVQNHYRGRRKIIIRNFVPVPIKSEFTPDHEVYQWIIDNAGMSEKGRNYIVNERHFPESVIEQYKIRSLSKNDGILKRCLDKFGQERLLKCGVAKIRERDGKQFVGHMWFSDVILFPYYDQDNRIVYIQARNMESESQLKYIGLNGIETTLYNMPVLKKLTTGDMVFICEGVMDCISLGLMGRNAIGVIGAQGFKNEYVPMLKDFTIVVIPDNDDTGTKFANTMTQLFLKVGNVVQVRTLPKRVKDVTEYYVCKREQ